MAKNIQNNIPDAELQAELDLIEATGWIVLSKEKKDGGWTVISVSPDDPEAPGHHAADGGSGPASSAGGAGAAGGLGAAPGDANDILTLARTIYGEARGESKAGREAVANVVMNRSRWNPASRYGGGTVHGVCMQPWQFSCWNASDPNLAAIRNLQRGDNAVFDECYDIAARAVAGTLADSTGGATHYYANYISAPNWTSPPARLTTQIGVHRFYADVA